MRQFGWQMKGQRFYSGKPDAGARAHPVSSEYGLMLAIRGQAFMQWVMDRFRYVLEVVKRSGDLAGFKVVPKRWIVERTFGWLLWSHRLNKDYEVLLRTAEAFVYVTMIRLMICRLTDAT